MAGTLSSEGRRWSRRKPRETFAAMRGLRGSLSYVSADISTAPLGVKLGRQGCGPFLWSNTMVTCLLPHVIFIVL